MPALVPPQTPSDAAALAATLLGPLASLGPSRAARSFENLASAVAGPIVRLAEFSSTPLLPNFVVTLHSSGQVVLWLGGVDQPSQAIAFLGGLPPSGFQVLGGPNDSVQSYAMNVATKVAQLNAPAFSPAFAIGHSLGGAALAVYAGGLGQASPIDLQVALSVGAPKPGAAGDFTPVGPPRFYRFWTPPDPVIALPPAITDAPFAAIAAGPTVAYNWNQQVQAAGGYAVSAGSLPYAAQGGRASPAFDVVSFAGLFTGKTAAEIASHSLANYVTVLAQAGSPGLKADLVRDADGLSKPQLFLTPAQVSVQLANPGFAAEFIRERNMVPRVIIPTDDLPTVERYLGSWAVMWEGQVLGTFDMRYMANILQREIVKVMKRTSLMSALDQAAWVSAVTTWVADLQSVGGGFSPQPPAL